MKNTHSLCFLFVSLLSFGTGLFADSLAIVSPKNGGIVSNMKPAQRMYVELPEDKARELLSKTSLASDFAATVHSQPQGVILDWTFKGDRKNTSYRVTLSESHNLKNPIIYTPGHSQQIVYNLEIGKTYYWKAEVCYSDGRVLSTPVNSFTVDPQTPRVMFVPNMHNVRDLGGRRGLDGRMIPQNLIFRSAGINFNSPDGGKTPGKPQFNEEGRRILRDVMKIRTDLDLRSARETASMTESPIGPDVNFINISSRAYADIYSQGGMENYAKLFRVFCDKRNYPIDFHCIGGADRTGSLAYLLLATLGVDREEIMKDYTFTSFYTARIHKYFDSLDNGMAHFGTKDEPLSWKAERYLLRAGITVAEINTFREIVLGPGLTPSPVVKEASMLDDMLRDVAGKPSLFDFAAKIDRIKLPYCGKLIDTPLVSPRAVNLRSGGTNGTLTRLLLNNPSDTSLAVMLTPHADLPGNDYTVFFPLEKVLLLSPAGARQWKVDELKKLNINIEPYTERLLEISVSPSNVNDMKEVDFVELETSKTETITAEVVDNIVIDGKMDDAEWQAASVLRLNNRNGLPRTDGANLHLAVNSAHDTLFIAAQIKASSITAMNSKRDGESWEDDCIEIFLSSVGHQTYYQFVVNADNALYDGRIRDGQWNAKQFTSATSRTPDGWIIEIALPLAQFGFTSAPAINFCTFNPATNKRRSLFPVGENNHSRSAMHPVIWK
ncbi:MAG: tyrosine-protein phosphatase [Victivallales bacterium]|nr:tyrosine-protein phosphatase [Victivallales bacterium]